MDKSAPPEPKSVRKRGLRTAARSDVSKDGSVPVREKKKRKFGKRWIWLTVVCVVFVLIVIAGLPAKGTIKYGLCKTFLELNDPYPQSLVFLQGTESGNNVIIDYNKTDGFGQRTINQIRCYFKDDPQTFYKLNRVDVNGKNFVTTMEAQPAIDKFNAGILSIIAEKPDLILPPGLPADIKDYQ